MTATSSIRIGILQTDSVRDEFRSRHGDYPDMFRQVLSAAAQAEDGAGIEFVDYDVQHGVYPERLDDCDGYLITGSRESVYDDLPWIAGLEDFVLRLHAERRKLVGICFGHQLVAQALGGETRAADVGWAVGVHCSRLTAPLPWTRQLADEFSILSSHKDQVTRLPEGARLLATNDHCPFAAFSVGDHILKFQGRPGFSKPSAEALMRFREAMLGEDVFARGIASLGEDIQPLLVARWILDFLRWRDEAAA